MPFVDFAELKSRVSIEHAVQMLSLSLNKSGAQLRGPCPVCNTGGDRALVVTPEKGLFYCFAAKTGGDQIALAAHIKGIKTSEAAGFLAGNSTVPVPRNRTVPGTVPPAPPEKGFRPLDYLQPQHEAVQGLGISKETAEAFGAGYAPKGILRGRLAIPIHDRDGTLLAYCGRTVKNESPSQSSQSYRATSTLGIDNGTGYRQVVQLGKGLRVYSTAGWRKRCVCPYLGCRESWPQQSQ
jgi:DNA primase